MDWLKTAVRHRMVHPVLELPTAESLQRVRPIASAAPSSIAYLPGPATSSMSVGTGLTAQGNAFLGGFDDGGGFVEVSGPVFLPVVGGGTRQVTLPIPSAGWAIDRTRARQSGTQIELLIDVAVAGPSHFLRRAYSLFVMISPSLIQKTEFPPIATHDP